MSGDLQALLAATDIAMLFLDREFRILRYTPRVTELFNLRPVDRGRPVGDLTHRLEYDELEGDAARVLERLVPVEREVRDAQDRWYMTRVLPYRSQEDRIEGVVVTFVEITDRKRAEEEVRQGREYAESIVETLHEPLLVLDPELRVRSVNHAFYEHFQVEQQHTIGRRIYDLGNGQWDIPELRTLLEDVLPDSNVFNDYEVRHTFEDIGERIMLLNARRLDHVQLILLGIRDITERKRQERHQQFLAEVSGELVNLTDVADTMERLGAKIAGHFDANWCMFSEIRGTGETSMAAWGWHEPNVSSLAGTYSIAHFLSRAIRQRLDTGEPLVVGDTREHPGVSAEAYGALGIRSFIIVPLLRDGEQRFQLSVISARPRPWLADEVRLIRELAERTWTRLERARAEAELRAGEARYRTLFESMDQGYCVVEVIFDGDDEPVDFRFVEVNRAFERQAGLRDVVGKRMRELVPQLEEYWFRTYGRIARSGEPERFVDQARDLEGRWFDVYAYRIGDPQERRVAILFSDITERKEAEAALERRVAERTREVRELAQTLSMAEQEERQRISQLLHDDLQQLLYGIQMKLALALERAERSDAPGAVEQGRRSLELIEQAITRTRQLTVELNPPILQDEGLLGALEWLRTQMRDLHGLTVEIRAEGEVEIAPDLRILLFQITRELLFNVAKHAETDRAVVEVSKQDGRLRLAVIDHGKGFDAAAIEQRPASRGGLGLVSVRERLRLRGGDMEIESIPGGGSRVLAYAPLSPGS